MLHTASKAFPSGGRQSGRAHGGGNPRKQIGTLPREHLPTVTTAINLWKKRGAAKYSLTLRWTAGHVNIEGNEMTDKEAKLAAEGTTSETATLPKSLRKPLKHNKSAAKQHFKSGLNSIWRKEWQKSPRIERLKHIDPSLPSQKFLKLTSDPKLSRKGASWLYQLRIGHFPLNAYLHRFKRTDSARCLACGYHSENPQHFLLDCPAYAHERWPLMAGESLANKEYTKLISDAKNAIPIVSFIQATGRFAQELGQRVGAGMGTGNGNGKREDGTRERHERD